MNRWVVLAIIIGAVLMAVIVGGLMTGSIPERLITEFADAITYAEGGNREDTRPFRNNNPGDLTRDLTGQGVGWDGPFVKYASYADGFESLKQQVRLFYHGSGIYNKNMTIADVAGNYTDAAEAPEWARNVAAKLNVSPDTKLTDLLTKYQVG